MQYAACDAFVAIEIMEDSPGCDDLALRLTEGAATIWVLLLVDIEDLGQLF